MVFHFYKSEKIPFCLLSYLITYILTYLIVLYISVSVGHGSEKFNIVSNDHGRTEKCDFCVLVCKINFTDHCTPDLDIRFRSVTFTPVTVRKNSKHLHYFLSSDASDCNGI